MTQKWPVGTHLRVVLLMALNWPVQANKRLFKVPVIVNLQCHVNKENNILKINAYVPIILFMLFVFFSESLLFDKHEDIFSFKKRPFQSKSEIYEESLAKSVKIFQLKRDNNWTDEDFQMVCR